MKLTRLILLAATAAGATYWFKGRNPAGLAAGPRLRLALGAGMGGAALAASPVAETMWTPSDPATPAGTSGDSPAASPAGPR